VIDRFLIGFAVACFLLAGVSGCGSSETEHICNVHTVVPGLLIRGCQPSERGLQELRDRFGVRTIVNLNNLSSKSQAKVVERTGLNYLPLPDNPIWEGDDHDVHIAFLKEVRNARTNGDAVVYLHCKTGTDRVGLAIAVYRIVECGWTAERALDELHLYQSWFFRILMFRYPAILRNVERHREEWIRELEKMPDPPVRRAATSTTRSS
jgi:protein tyrosine/serine phosphatase